MCPSLSISNNFNRLCPPSNFSLWSRALFTSVPLSSFSAGSSTLPSPQVDTLSFQNLDTQQLLKRLFLTRKLLALKKLALKNKAMAVNLETLLPQAFSSQTTPPVVPSNTGTVEESRFRDLFSPTSMYGSDGLSLLAMVGESNSLDFDPALLKSDYLPSTDGGSQDALYQGSSGELDSKSTPQ